MPSRKKINWKEYVHHGQRTMAHRVISAIQRCDQYSERTILAFERAVRYGIIVAAPTVGKSITTALINASTASVNSTLPKVAYGLGPKTWDCRRGSFDNMIEEPLVLKHVFGAGAVDTDDMWDELIAAGEISSKVIEPDYDYYSREDKAKQIGAKCGVLARDGKMIFTNMFSEQFRMNFMHSRFTQNLPSIRFGDGIDFDVKQGRFNPEALLRHLPVPTVPQRKFPLLVLRLPEFMAEFSVQREKDGGSGMSGITVETAIEVFDGYASYADQYFEHVVVLSDSMLDELVRILSYMIVQDSRVEVPASER